MCGCGRRLTTVGKKCGIGVGVDVVLSQLEVLLKTLMKKKNITVKFGAIECLILRLRVRFIHNGGTWDHRGNGRVSLGPPGREEA